MKKSQTLLSQRELKQSLLAGSITTVSVICGIIPFFWVMNIINILKTDKDPRAIGLNCLFITLALALKAVLYSIGIKRSHKVAFTALASIRDRLINHIYRLKFLDIKKHKTGELLQIINHEVEQVEIFMAHALPELIISLTVPIVIILSLFFIQWQFALILLAVLPLLFIDMKYLKIKFDSRFAVYVQKQTEISEDLLEYIAGISTIKAFNRDEKKTDSLLDKMADYIIWVKKLTADMTIFGILQNTIVGSGSVAIILYGSKLLLANSINFENYIIGIVFAGFFAASIAKLMTFTHKTMMFKHSKKNIVAILNIPLPKEDKLTSQIKSKDVTFKNVNFSYENSISILNGINFTAKENTTTSLIGFSGSGKTTIANLIAGFIKTESGEILIGDKNIDDINEEYLFDLVSIVEQNVFLFNTTIKENILIGNLEATENQVIEAAKKAMIHETIANLEKGYDTQVGEGGCKLSGGEKQRISIARMILKNNPIIILDEATSAIDPLNEKLIMKAMKNLGEGKTVISIAHHMESVKNSDNIILLDKGNIINQGGHLEMLDKSRLYKEMVNAQKEVDGWTIKEYA